MLARAPSVGRVAVVGMPDDRWGQQLVAFVELAQGQQSGEGAQCALPSSRARRLQMSEGNGVRTLISAVARRQVVGRERRAGNHRRVG